MDEYAPLLRDAADAVEALVRRIPRADLGKSGGVGASGQPSKHIDRLAEAEVLQVLEDSGIALDVCTEEAGTIRRGGTKTLVVDPIDGTQNASRGIPFYCVSLAIATTSLADVEMGLVRNLVNGDTYEAVRSGGASLNGEPIRVAPFDPREGVRSSVRDPRKGPVLSSRLLSAPYVREMGAAALEMSLVAQGAMDAYVHLTSGLRIVDIAASTLIVREAGGVVVLPDGGVPALPLDVRARTNLVAVGDRAVLERIGVSV